MSEFGAVPARQDATATGRVDAPIVPRIQGEVDVRKQRLQDPFVQALAAIADGGDPPAGSIPGGTMGLGALSIGLSKVAADNNLNGMQDAARFLVMSDVDKLNEFKQMLSASEDPNPKPLFR